ncbi:hypothetical protein OG616_03295 [Streptomyces antibioticus]|uniref:hypothetical protein n=1 Tax=Streptomyces antibioticus TaxID=1890 RepID=UPI002255736B|nr:hypothetical protein [Streptomyces antibioticus]MCX5167037.1 hypothetical protein [Streptomyces antibioticus]
MTGSPPPWPDVAAFDTAVQRAAFPRHGRLAGAVVERRGGLMRRMEGANAVAYVLRASDGALVLRCFKERPTPALRLRYEALEKWAARADADAEGSWVPADAEWVEEAVRIDDHWWPAVVMEHVAGDSLRAHLEARAGRREELTLLADRWRGVLAWLDGLGMAHGDLQHDNVRIEEGGRIRLIDLDAVWTSELSAEAPREYGHPHFQHPERLRDGHGDRTADRFSALVIQASILALAVDPGLWDDFHNEDNLLFTAEDFALPMATPLWFRLAASRSVEVRRLTALLDGACRGPLSEVPPFRELDAPEPTAASAPSAGWTLTTPVPAPPIAPPLVPVPPAVPAPPTIPVVPSVPSMPSMPPVPTVVPEAPPPEAADRAAAPGAEDRTIPFTRPVPEARRGAPPARPVLIGAGLALLMLLAVLIGVVR